MQQKQHYSATLRPLHRGAAAFWEKHFQNQSAIFTWPLRTRLDKQLYVIIQNQISVQLCVSFSPLYKLPFVYLLQYWHFSFLVIYWRLLNSVLMYLSFLQQRYTAELWKSVDRINAACDRLLPDCGEQTGPSLKWTYNQSKVCIFQVSRKQRWTAAEFTLVCLCGQKKR